MNTIQSSITAALAAALGMFFVSTATAASPSNGIAPAKLDTWQQVSPSAYEKLNTDGSFERLEINGNVQPDALHSTSGTMCVNIAGPAHNGYAYQFDSDIATGLLGTTAIARAHVADVPSRISPDPTVSSVTSTATTSNGATSHITNNSGGFGTIVSAVSNFDFYPVPLLCSASTYSKITLKGGACAVETSVDYSNSSDCTD